MEPEAPWAVLQKSVGDPRKEEKWGVDPAETLGSPVEAPGGPVDGEEIRSMCILGGGEEVSFGRREVQEFQYFKSFIRAE